MTNFFNPRSFDAFRAALSPRTGIPSERKSLSSGSALAHFLRSQRRPSISSWTCGVWRMISARWHGPHDDLADGVRIALRLSAIGAVLASFLNRPAYRFAIGLAGLFPRLFCLTERSGGGVQSWASGPDPVPAPSSRGARSALTYGLPASATPDAVTNSPKMNGPAIRFNERPGRDLVRCMRRVLLACCAIGLVGSSSRPYDMQSVNRRLPRQPERDQLAALASSAEDVCTDRPAALIPDNSKWLTRRGACG